MINGRGVCMKEKTAFSFKKLWNIVDPPLWQLILGMLLAIINTGASLTIPLFIKQVMDAFTTKITPELVFILIALFVLQIVTSAFSLFLLSRVGLQIVRDLRTKAWHKLLRLPISFYDQNKSGELISRVTNDTTIVMNLLSTEIVQFVTSILSVIVSVIILFTLDVPMTLILLSAIPVTFLVVVPIGRKMYKISYAQQNKMSDVTSFLTQMLSEIRLIKAYTTEKAEYETGKEKFQSLFQSGVSKAKIQSVLAPLMMAIMMAMLVILVGFGAYRVSQGYISSGELVAFVLYLFQIIVPVSTMSRFVTSFQETKGATERLFTILGEKEENLDGIAPVPSPNVLEFQHISFGYGNHEVLKDISFSARKGTTTAFVGPSGVGKTTMFSLIERYYEPTAGDIFIEGVPMDDIRLEDWRRLFSYVPQEAPMLTGTIRDNITYGMVDSVTDEQIMEAAKLANAHDFIESFEDGYHAMVGERGINLSGGQRQRIAIARAILRNPQFLLLDEATASLDSESERFIQQSFETLMKGRTSFVIAHRLSTVVDADQIIVMEDGKISGIGTHEELIRSHSFYRMIVEQQFKQSVV